MSCAFDDGPDSGEMRSADASGATARTAARTTRGSRRSRSGRKAGDLYRLAPGELRLALLDERPHALLEVLRSRQGVLELRFEVQLARHVGVEHPVERLLRPRVRAGRPGRELLDQGVRLVHQAVVSVDG